MMKKTILFTTASAIIMAASPAIAAEQMSMEEIQAQLKALSAQVNNLSKVVEQQNETIKRQEAQIASQKQANAVAIEKAVANIQPAAGGVDTSDVKITMKPMPKIESKDGKYSFQPFGRVHMDVTHFDDDMFDHASNVNFRRARLGFKGNLGEDFKYKSEVEFAGEAVNIRDMTLTYTGLDAVDLSIGNQKSKFGMEENTSSNYLMMIERSSATNAFARGHLLGANALAGGDNWSVGIGVFNEDVGNNNTGEDEDVSYDARGSVNVLGLVNPESEHVVHLGAGVSHRRPTGMVRFRARPGTGDGARTIDTGNIGSVDSVNVYGLELASVVGPFSVQGEYFDTDVSRDGGNPDADFDGYFGQVGFFLTGETRPYDGSSGNFKRVKPNTPFSLSNGGWGAWEILARYDNTDLNDVGAGIMGGEMETITGGVNWHLTDHVRVMANVISVDTDANAATAANDDPTVYNMRAQWDF